MSMLGNDHVLIDLNDTVYNLFSIYIALIASACSAILILGFIIDFSISIFTINIPLIFRLTPFSSITWIGR